MEVRSIDNGGWKILELAGAINAPASPQLEAALTPLAGGPQGIILDFANVDYISSLGARVLLASNKKHEPVRGPLVVCNLQPALVSFMDISGLDDILHIVPTREDALALDSKV